jgi:hypothetical protein
MGSRTITLALALLMAAALLTGPVAARDGDDGESAAVEIALAHLVEEHGPADVAGAVITDVYTSDHNGVTHVYLRQAVDGLEVRGAEATVNVQDGDVIHSGSRFLGDVRSASSGTQVVAPGAAAAIAARSAGADPDEVTAAPQLAYRALHDATARLAWDVAVVTAEHWWHTFVDAETGDVLHAEDWVDSHHAGHLLASTARPEHAAAVRSVVAADPILPPEQVEDGSSYRVYPLPLESPNDGDRSIVANPADAVASPFGWHDTDGADGHKHTITRGNNVHAYADTAPRNAPDPDGEPDGGDELAFDFPIPTFDATPAVYRQAAVTNLFYWNNVMHDVTFRYGFDEAAGNFQERNRSGHGVGEDAVLAEAQDGGGVLNANFATPPDGQPGRMQMFLWVDAFQTLGLSRDDIVRTYSHEVRDGDLDGGVIAHEYGHGVSNRLVGGPSNVSCLREHDERQGEGWSDWWSYVLTMREGDDGATPRGIGTYVVYMDEGRTADGIRITPYSTDMEVNPSTYDTIRTAAEPHGVGYVWATMLWDLYWSLVEEHGFNPNPYESWQTGGNNLALQLVVDGMKMSACEPGFADARDAIIAADAALTGDVAAGRPGENECLIWRTFARRGLGVDADQGDPSDKTDGIEGYAAPTHCGG